jgi:hypothetical protein
VNIGSVMGTRGRSGQRASRRRPGLVMRGHVSQFGSRFAERLDGCRDLGPSRLE